MSDDLKLCRCACHTYGNTRHSDCCTIHVLRDGLIECCESARAWRRNFFVSIAMQMIVLAYLIWLKGNP